MDNLAVCVYQENDKNPVKPIQKFAQKFPWYIQRSRLDGLKPIP